MMDGRSSSEILFPDVSPRPFTETSSTGFSPDSTNNIGNVSSHAVEVLSTKVCVAPKTKCFFLLIFRMGNTPINQTRTHTLSVRLAGSGSVASGPKERSFLLFVKPTKKSLETRIRLDLLDRVERVAQFVMAPRFVEEILAGMTSGHNFSSSFAPW